MSSPKTEDVFTHTNQAQKFAVHFRKLRIEKGLTQDELAVEADVDRSTIARIEAGRQNITLDTIFGLSEALKIPAKALFDFEK